MSAEGTISCSQCGRPLSDAARFCERCGTPTNADVDDEGLGLKPIREGDVLDGKWRIERKLGTGGMGTVFLALDQALDRHVAIKALAPGLCSDAEFLARFEREARATAQLEHPNIVPVYAVARYYGRPFIVMKRLTGQSLAYWLKGMNAKKERPGRETAVSMLRQLAAGLGAIHKGGFVHRDLKPGNVYVGDDGHVTILDFGILRDSGSGQHLTRSGVPLGTPHYMAPEQAWGAKDVDGRADVYALGALFYEILCGEPPYDDPDAMALMKLHASAPPPDVRAMRPEIPVGVSLAIQKAMAKKRDHRFPSAVAFYEAVESEWSADGEGAAASAPPAAKPEAPGRREEPPVAVAPLIDEPDSLPRPGAPAAAPAAAGVGEFRLTPRKAPRSVPRPLPQQVAQPETPDDAVALPETKKRTLFIAAVVVEALVVLAVLAWAFWPSPPKEEPKPVAEPPAATTPATTPAVAAPTTPKPRGPVIDPAHSGVPTLPLPPTSLDPMKPPAVDFRPPEAPAMPALDPTKDLAPSPSPGPKAEPPAPGK